MPHAPSRAFHHAPAIHCPAWLCCPSTAIGALYPLNLLRLPFSPLRRRSPFPPLSRPPPPQIESIERLQPRGQGRLLARADAMAALIDPTFKGRYPVILGEGMLDRTSNDIFTGIRCGSHSPSPSPGEAPSDGVDQSAIADNHRPTLSSSDAPAHARLKPSLPGKTTSYDLSYTDGGSSYAYSGTRSVGDDQYVLHFDPERKAFILDKVDSTFNMSVTRLPGHTDPAKLARQYPPLDGPKPKPVSKPPAKNAAQQSRPSRRKSEKKQQQPPPPPPPPQHDVALSLPQPEPPKADKKKSSKRADRDEEDEEEDDGDGDLLVEYPGDDNAAAKLNDFSPAFPAFPPPRRFEDFMDQRDSEGDADLGLKFKLPSPVNQPHHHDHQNQQHPSAHDPQGGDDEPASADMEDDLEKELENAFEDLANSQEGSPDGGDESEISEED